MEGAAAEPALVVKEPLRPLHLETRVSLLRGARAGRHLPHLLRLPGTVLYLLLPVIPEREPHHAAVES